MADRAIPNWNARYPIVSNWSSITPMTWVYDRCIYTISIGVINQPKKGVAIARINFEEIKHTHIYI